MKLGYNTNGFAHHHLTDAIEILADIGYRSVAITIDHHALNPFSDHLPAKIKRVGDLLRRRNMGCVIETGARFLLDPTRKHRPTLLTADNELRGRRFDFLCRAIEIAAELGAEAVSFWSGAGEPSLSERQAWDRLAEMCDRLLTRAVRHEMRLAFEPEPGMFVERLAQFARLSEALNHPRFGLTLDVGHVHCLADGRPAERIREFAGSLLNVHIEDMKAGVHEHLMFGEGEIDWPPVLKAIGDIPATVELSRHSHDAVATCRRAFSFLRDA